MQGHIHTALGSSHLLNLKIGTSTAGFDNCLDNVLGLIPIVLIQSNKVDVVMLSDLGECIETLSVEDEGDTDTYTSESSRTADTVKVGFWIWGIVHASFHGDIVIDDHRDGRHINTSSENVRRDKDLSLTRAELFQDVVAIIPVERTVNSNNFMSIGSQAFGNSACGLSFLKRIRPDHPKVGRVFLP